MSDLKFDDIVEVDIKLAKEYLREISSDIHSLGLEDFEDGNYDHDSCHNKLYFVDYNKVRIKLQKTSEDSASVEMFNKLACKVEVNAELLAQLEYMTRKVPVHETNNCHIKLIVQNLLYWSTQVGQFNQFSNFGHIIMHGTTPLSSLGCLAPLLCIHKSCVIESTKETAVVCHLLTQLCYEVGMKNVYLMLVEDPTNIKTINQAIDLNNIDRLVRAGAGIVTGHADIDSAVDAFLTATTTFPWHLRRLLIQENVYESFKKAISWKTSLKQSGNNNCQPILDRYESKCTDLFIYDEKVFLLNYVGSIEELQEMTKCAIVVEAYRTTKELLSLVKQYQPYCLSVWSSDIAEANEIAFGIDTSIVWINDINNFDGPPKTSQGFYSNILLNHFALGLDKTDDFEIVIKLRTNWLKLDLNERRQKIFKAIEECDFEDNKVIADFAKELRRSVCEASNKFIEIEGSRMCVGIQDTVGTIFGFVKSLDKLIDVIKSSIFGNGVVVSLFYGIESNNTGHFSKLIELLKKEGVPIIIRDNLPSGDFLEIKSPYLMFKTRVIWTSFGTIFAN